MNTRASKLIDRLTEEDGVEMPENDNVLLVLYSVIEDKLMSDTETNLFEDLRIKELASEILDIININY